MAGLSFGKLARLQCGMTLEFRDKGKSQTQIAVYSNELKIADIGKEFYSVMAGGKPHFLWRFRMEGPPGFEETGDVDSMEKAQEAVKRNWQVWLTAAGLKSA